jgi:hypothetical protein
LVVELVGRHVPLPDLLRWIGHLSREWLLGPTVKARPDKLAESRGCFFEGVGALAARYSPGSEMICGRRKHIGELTGTSKGAHDMKHQAGRPRDLEDA